MQFSALFSYLIALNLGLSSGRGVGLIRTLKKLRLEWFETS